MEMLKIYHEHSKAARYYLGFENKHERRVYAAFVKPEELALFIVDDMTAANEAGERFPCIRYKVGKHRDKLEAGLLPTWERLEAVRRVCTTDELKARAKCDGVNLGEAFEALVCERLKLERNTNTTAAWYEAPDAWDNGTPIQIGYEGKTFTYTAQIERMGWA